ncbi:MAG: hypothetical protein QXG81_00990 [Ignisphaera sp.]
MRGQSELLSTFVIIGVAVVIGVAMISYFVSLVSTYRSNVDLASYLQKEASNNLINIVSYDDASSSLWILLKKADGSSTDFFIAVDVNGSFLNCSKVLVYNVTRDSNGILCDSKDSDCAKAVEVFRGSLNRVYIPWGGAISSYLSYAKAMGYTSSGDMPICRVWNVCRYTAKAGLCGESTIAQLQLGGTTTKVRILVIAFYSNTPYVVGIHEVALR